MGKELFDFRYTGRDSLPANALMLMRVMSPHVQAITGVN